MLELSVSEADESVSDVLSCSLELFRLKWFAGWFAGWFGASSARSSAQVLVCEPLI